MLMSGWQRRRSWSPLDLILAFGPTTIFNPGWRSSINSLKCMHLSYNRSLEPGASLEFMQCFY